MDFKTILCHLCDDDANEVRLRTAAGLARSCAAHLVGLYVAAPLEIPSGVAGRSASAAFLAEATDAARAHADAFRPVAEEIAQAHGVPWEWRVVDGPHLDVLVEQSRFADVVVVSGTAHAHYEDRFIPHLPDHLTVVAGVPVIVLPRGWAAEPEAWTRSILVAWKDTPESLRAVRAAMPLLRRAERVLVLACREAGDERDPEVDGLLTFLARHGVEAAGRVAGDGAGHAGEVVLDTLQDEGLELLVMGATRRSMLQQLMFGGMTVYVMNHMTRPVLMRH